MQLIAMCDHHIKVFLYFDHKIAALINYILFIFINEFLVNGFIWLLTHGINPISYSLSKYGYWQFYH